MNKTIALSYILLLFFALNSTTASYACEEFKSISTSELKEYRNKLKEKNADPFDKLFAFEELVCSDKQSIRALAIREGLESSQDSLLRNQVMFDALMQKGRVDIELSSAGKLTSKDKNFIRKHSGVFTRIVESRYRKLGCIAFHRQKCDLSRSLIIKGDTVNFTFIRIVGKFKLTGQNELVGFIRPDNDGRHSKIPAVIKLF